MHPRCAYSQSQSNLQKTGGQEYNSPHHSGQSGQQRYSGPEIDHDAAISAAQSHGPGSGHSELFASALGFLNDNKQAHQEPVDESEVTQAHDVAYQQGNAGNLDARSLGSAAALQALKRFTSGGGSLSSTSGGGSGNTQTQLISMAMAEAAKLFDKSGGVTSGNKQDAVNGAAMTVMKLLFQSKFSGGTTGGSDSGGLGSLLGLASKFL